MRLVGDPKYYTDPGYWEREGIEKPVTRIICAANIIEYEGKEILLIGARHFDAQMRLQLLNMGLKSPEYKRGESGFIDQFGYFHNRKEALKIVLENGQPFNPKRNGSEEELFSEGLY